tara:strand:+ start:246 stop:467 length:222 start_codon:yes stop_codon:yes gene_type:complete
MNKAQELLVVLNEVVDTKIDKKVIQLGKELGFPTLTSKSQKTITGAELKSILFKAVTFGVFSASTPHRLRHPK